MKILFVEDDYSIRRFYRDYCDCKGWSSIFAGTVDDAKSEVSSKVFDVIVLDHRIGGGTGEDVLAFIKELGLTAKIYAASSLGEGNYPGCVSVRKDNVCRKILSDTLTYNQYHDQVVGRVKGVLEGRPSYSGHVVEDTIKSLFDAGLTIEEAVEKIVQP